jgi:hypothetical protein
MLTPFKKPILMGSKCHQGFGYEGKYAQLQLDFTIINEGEHYTSTIVFLALQCLWY